MKIDALLSGIRRAIEHAVSARRSSSEEYERQMVDYRRYRQQLEAVVRDCKALWLEVTA